MKRVILGLRMGILQVEQMDSLASLENEHSRERGDDLFWEL